MGGSENHVEIIIMTNYERRGTTVPMESYVRTAIRIACLAALDGLDLEYLVHKKGGSVGNCKPCVCRSRQRAELVTCVVQVWVDFD